MANPLRGEADLTIGNVTLTLAATMEGLARLSAATGHPSFEELYARLAGTEPATALAALRHFTVAGKVAGREVKPAEAAEAAIAELDILALTTLRGPFAALLQGLLREVPAGTAAGAPTGNA